MVMRHVVGVHNAIADAEHNVTERPVRSNYSDNGARFDVACFSPSGCLKIFHQTQAAAAIWVFRRNNIEIISFAVEFDIGERVHVAALVQARVFHESGGYKGMCDVRGAAITVLLGAFVDVMPAHDENHEKCNEHLCHQGGTAHMQYGALVVTLVTYLLAAGARGVFAIAIPSGVRILNLIGFACDNDDLRMRCQTLK